MPESKVVATYENMREWYNNGGREQVRERAKVARASARALSESLVPDWRYLDKPMDY